MARLVVIGGDAAGMSAASQVRRMQPEREIIVFERGSYTSYAACGIPFMWLAWWRMSADSLPARRNSSGKYRIQAMIRHEVLAIFPKEQRILVRDLEKNEERQEPYDELLIATGADPVRTGFDGEESANVHLVSTLAHAQDIDQALSNGGDGAVRQIVIVGGGYIGLEMAEAFQLRGLEVTMIHRGPEVMATFDPDMGHYVSEALRQSGIDLYLHTALEGFTHENGKVSALLTSQGSIPADMVILGIGVRPTSRLAKEAGLSLGPKTASGSTSCSKPTMRISGLRATAPSPSTWSAANLLI